MEATQELGRGKDTGNWPAIVRLLKLSLQYRWTSLRVLLLQIVLLFMTLGGLSFTGLGIDFIRFQVDPGGAPAPVWPFGLAPSSDWTPMGVVFLIGALVCGFAVVKGVMEYFYSVSVARLVQTDIVVNLRAQVYGKLQQLSFRFFDANSSGSIINRVTGDVQNLRMFIDGVMLPILVLLVSFAVFLTYMFSMHVKLTLACLAPFPILAVITFLFSKKVRPMYMENRRLVDRMIMFLAECIQGTSVIKGFGRERDQEAKFSASNGQVRDQQQNIFWRISFYNPGVNFLTQISIMILLGYGGWLVITEGFPLGAGLLVFAGLLHQLADRVNQIATITNSAQQSLIGARRVFEILDAPVAVQNAEHPKEVEALEGRVVFENVWFNYLENEAVLEDVSFTVKAGENIAILGETGAGKSVLLSLIPRFYDCQKGRITIDGLDVREWDLETLRRCIGIVFQESFLFSNTIAANIAFGRPDADMEAIERAARIAAAHEFIVDLPEGYETILGESGVNLSGGQRQRLAIARALLLDPTILILDDATAALDSKTEQEIFAALNRAMAGRTTFIVAHKFSTLRRADRILVLERGRIVQTGRHDDLMGQVGPYRRIARLQLVDAQEMERARLAVEETGGSI